MIVSVIELRTQSDLRSARQIQFCAICGKHFQPQEKRSRHHVPPKAIFAKSDRTPPLILPTHMRCNSDQSPFDTVIGQLVALLHGKAPTPDQVRLEVDAFTNDRGRPVAGVKNLPFRQIVFRWARYFHAALYREFLKDRGGMVYGPFPSGDVSDGRITYSKNLPDRYKLTYELKRQVTAGRTDSIVCYNGKCHYRCTWIRFDDGRPYCLFGLRLYNWEVLGDRGQETMGCMGWYFADTPTDGARGTRLEIPASNFVPLDPFAP